MYKIQKRNGSFQDFDRNRIINSILKSGGSNGIAQKAAGLVETWLPIAAVDNTVSSVRLRAQVIKILQELSPVTASSFNSHRLRF